MITSKQQEFDTALHSILNKIDAGIVTCEDFNGLINKTIIGETSPEAVRDRVRRRTIRNATDSHIDSETGHQSLTLPSFADRVQPKRKPRHQQNHGRARIAHAHSIRTQQSKINDAVEFIRKYQGSLVTEEMLEGVDKGLLRKLVVRLMSHPHTNRDWLYELSRKLDKS